MLAAVAVLTAASVVAGAPGPCNLDATTITGRWKDPRAAAVFAVHEAELPALSWTAAGPWPGTPHGRLWGNGSVSLTFSPSNTAVGVVSGAGCTFITWTDPPDKAAGNTWCKVGSASCAAPPAPPAPPTPVPPAAGQYPPVSGGAYSGAPAPASPDPLVRYRWDDATIAKPASFQAYRRRPAAVLGPPPPGFAGASSLLAGSAAGRGGMRVTGTGSIGFDFGSECAGWLEFDSPDLVLGPTSRHLHLHPRPRRPASAAVVHAPAVAAAVAMSTSEYTLPQFTTGTRNNNHGNCTASPQPVAGIPGRYRLVVNPELYEGLRYGWLHVQAAAAGGFTVTNFTAVCQAIPINYEDHAFEARGAAVPAGAEPGAGSFALEQVWYTAMYTTRVDLLPGGFGSILMDRGDRISWTGDAHLAQKAAMAGFGGDHGSAMVQANTERTKGVDNGIISYDMYFVLSAVDYFLHTNDTAAFEGWALLIVQKFATAQRFWASPGHQSFCGSDDRIGADFENTPASEHEKTRYYKMLSVQAVLEYARAVALCAACSAGTRTSAAQLQTEFKGYFERERGALGTPGVYGMHAGAGAVLTGLTTAAEEQAIFDALLSNPAHTCSFSPFNTYFVLEAVSRLRLVGGRAAAMGAALGMVRRCYHGMNRLGATTYWETFSPEWNAVFAPGDPTPNSQTGYMSHCHPWASGAAPWLTQHVVGLTPDAPGWANFTARPFLAPTSPTLLASVRGVQPLTGGRAIVAAFACNGSSSLEVPAGTLASLVALPLCGGTAKAVSINGHPAGSVEHGDDAVLLHDLGPGSYVFSVSFSAVASSVPAGVADDSFPQAAPSYRYRFVGADRSTGGDWVGKHGAGGWLFWSWNATTLDHERLPAGVEVTVHCPYTGVSGRAAAPNWASCSRDRRALEPPDSPGACHAIGAKLGGTTATIDVAGTGAHNVSLYLVDWDRLGRKAAVELRAADNLELAAPTQYVSNFTEGVYLTWEVELPVRLRLMQVPGPLPNNNALLAFSALLFD